MKRAKRRGIERNAPVVLGNAGTSDDVEVLTGALDDPEPLVREHAAWARARLRPPHGAVTPWKYQRRSGPGLTPRAGHRDCRSAARGVLAP
jgi:hypothetical protein